MDPSKKLRKHPSRTLRKQRKPSFFKILIKDFSSRLEFPPEFTHKFRKQIPNSTKLKLEVKGYHVKSWKVEVKKIGKIQCFSKGWREFVVENNLKEFDWLVFKYLANSKSFKVTIFGKTGCEKEFPVSRERNSKLVNCNNSQRNEQDGGKRKRVDEDDDDSNTDQMMKGARTNKNILDEDKAYERDVIRIDSDDEDKGTLKQTLCKGKPKEYCIEDKKALNKRRKCNSGENQIKFNSKNPFFEAELTKTNICGGYRHIPMWFVMEHLSMKKEKVARIHICKDSWPMRIYMIKNRRKVPREARISCGWGKFVKDKGLKIQDMCIFEMMKNNDRNVVFHVHVYRKFGEKDEFVKIW